MRRLLYPVLCLPVQSALCTTSRAAFSTCSSCAGQLSVSGSAALTLHPHLSSAALAEVQNWWEGSDWDSTALHQGKAVAFYLQPVIPRSDMDNVSNKCNFGLTDWGRFLMQKLMVIVYVRSFFFFTEILWPININSIKTNLSLIMMREWLLLCFVFALGLEICAFYLYFSTTAPVVVLSQRSLHNQHRRRSIVCVSDCNSRIQRQYADSVNSTKTNSRKYEP